MLKDIVIRQYVYEAESWERLLTFLIQENIGFKNRISEILESDITGEELYMIECLQEKFLSQDAILYYLNSELKQYNKLLAKDQCLNDQFFVDLLKNQKKLRDEIKTGEVCFAGVKEDFSNFLVQSFLRGNCGSYSFML